MKNRGRDRRMGASCAGCSGRTYLSPSSTDTAGSSTASANSSQGDKHMAWGTLVQRWFGNKGSAGLAKDRLQVVVMYDRLGLSAEQMEALRKDIMETISRHVAIDSERVKI